jgi:hypothetical protein
MRIMALIIAVILVSPGLVAAIDPVDQTGITTASELQEVRSYTGIIKNNSRCKVSIPSENSDATLLIPPHSWIEFTIWTQKSNVTAYCDGKPFYCLNIFAHPQEYPFMCKKYDFMAEIVKEEPVIRQGPSGPSKLKPRKKIKRKGENPPC